LEGEPYMEETEREEKLNRIYEFVDSMAEATSPKKKGSMPKWMLQGFFYGIFLGLIGYLAGAVAINAVPAAFPATLPVISAALGFLGSLGIAYTRDIME